MSKISISNLTELKPIYVDLQNTSVRTGLDNVTGLLHTSKLRTSFFQSNLPQPKNDRTIPAAALPIVAVPAFMRMWPTLSETSTSWPSTLMTPLSPAFTLRKAKDQLVHSLKTYFLGEGALPYVLGETKVTATPNGMVSSRALGAGYGPVRIKVEAIQDASGKWGRNYDFRAGMGFAIGFTFNKGEGFGPHFRYQLDPLNRLKISRLRTSIKNSSLERAAVQMGRTGGIDMSTKDFLAARRIARTNGLEEAVKFLKEKVPHADESLLEKALQARSKMLFNFGAQFALLFGFSIFYNELFDALGIDASNQTKTFASVASATSVWHLFTQRSFIGLPSALRKGFTVLAIFEGMGHVYDNLTGTEPNKTGINWGRMAFQFITTIILSMLLSAMWRRIMDWAKKPDDPDGDSPFNGYVSLVKGGLVFYDQTSLGGFVKMGFNKLRGSSNTILKVVETSEQQAQSPEILQPELPLPSEDRPAPIELKPQLLVDDSIPAIRSSIAEKRVLSNESKLLLLEAIDLARNYDLFSVSNQIKEALGENQGELLSQLLSDRRDDEITSQTGISTEKLPPQEQIILRALACERRWLEASQFIASSQRARNVASPMSQLSFGRSAISNSILSRVLVR